MTLTLPFRAMHALAVVAHKHGKMPGPEALTATSVEERKAQQPVRWALRKRPDGVRSEDLALSATAAVRVYSPAARSGGALLYIHGGGFVLGGLDACDHICADLASLTGHVVVSVDYRLAPEDPFPAGLDDCEQALHWLVAQAATSASTQDASRSRATAPAATSALRSRCGCGAATWRSPTRC